MVIGSCSHAFIVFHTLTVWSGLLGAFLTLAAGRHVIAGILQCPGITVEVLTLLNTVTTLLIIVVFIVPCSLTLLVDYFEPYF